MNPETARRLRDARRYAQDIRRFTEGATAESFLENRGLQLVVHKLPGDGSPAVPEDSPNP
jgi:uncharacterized protein with HEPN domain